MHRQLLEQLTRLLPWTYQYLQESQDIDALTPQEQCHALILSSITRPSLNDILSIRTTARNLPDYEFTIIISHDKVAKVDIRKDQTLLLSVNIHQYTMGLEEDFFRRHTPCET